MSANKEKQRDNLWALRHTAEHILTKAMIDLYGEDKIVMAMGPATDEGFYFDFNHPEDFDISEDMFAKIEKKMQEIVDADLPMVQKEVSVEEAREIFEGNKYKQEWLDEIVLRQAQDETKDEKVSLYQMGEEDGVFIDLCSGPHAKSTGEVKAFKLLSIAGAYWRGDEKNEMLTRIYGTAFESQEELDEYLEERKLAEERNHRKIGKEMELFQTFPEIGQGLPVWLPNGYAMRRVIEEYMLNLERGYGYEHILTPHINKAELFEISGHLSFYKESMYAPINIDEETYYLKPMNCPSGMMVYKRKPRSYRDLPIKMGELGTVYRYELSGELQGLQRVRGFTQNDAHIFCTPEQLEDEFMEVMEMLEKFYKDMGFDEYRFRLSLSDEEKDKYVGDRDAWLQAEDALRQMLEKNDVNFYEAPGEAAFYGPKVDVQATNVFGKEDTISTIQVDFNLAERFDINYIDENGEKKRPFVIHRALAGSFERYFAFLIEHHGGYFPLWFAPKQFIILPISDKFNDYAKKVEKALKKEGSEYNLWIRSEIDDRAETLQAKIRDAEMQRIPYILVVGGRDEEAGNVSVRVRGQGDKGAVKLEEFVDKVIGEIKERKMGLWG